MRKRRYRCTRKEFYMTIPSGKRILWADYRYPPLGHPPCTDDRTIDFIESKPAFEAGGIWIDKDPEEILINPDAVPDDCEAVHLQNAARQLVKMGLHVNPRLLKDPEEETEEPPQLPIKTLVSKYRRGELEDLIKEFDWDIKAEDFNVAELKSLVREKIEEASA